jgi:hypothetical protein
MSRPLVVLESPFKAFRTFSTDENIIYARKCVRASIFRGESPIASHLLYTQWGILDDKIPDERALGIECGLAWLHVADLHVFYTDNGWSEGMLSTLHTHLERFGNPLYPATPIKIRALYDTPHIPATFDEEVASYLLTCVES